MISTWASTGALRYRTIAHGAIALLHPLASRKFIDTRFQNDIFIFMNS